MDLDRSEEKQKFALLQIDKRLAILESAIDELKASVAERPATGIEDRLESLEDSQMLDRFDIIKIHEAFKKLTGVADISELESRIATLEKPVTVIPKIDVPKVEISKPEIPEDIEDRLDQLESSIESIKEVKGFKREDIKELESRIFDLESRIKSIGKREAIDAALKEIETAKRFVDERIGQFEKISKTGVPEDIRKKLEEGLALVEELERKSKTIDIEQIRKVFGKRLEELSESFEKRIENLNERIESLKIEAPTDMVRREQLQRVAQETRDQISNLSRGLDEFKKVSLETDVKAQFDQFSKNLSTLSANLDNLKGYIENFKKATVDELKSTKAQLDSFGKSVETLSRDLGSFKRDSEKLKKDAVAEIRAEMRKELSIFALNADLEKTWTEIEAGKKELAERLKIIDQLRKEMEKLKEIPKNVEELTKGFEAQLKDLREHVIKQRISEPIILE